MALTFTHPPHPSAALKDKPTPEVHIQTTERDPHNLPTFDANGEPTTPILYLPPLLSSLPHTIPSWDVGSSSALSTETHLPDIDPASLSLHRALHRFRPVSDAYADLPYAEGFNWADLELPEEEEREWYIVAFRSKRRDGSDGGPLYEADKLAHEEAVKNGGLIMYWYGIPNPETGMNLATCIWQSRKHAIAANSGPHHIKAMRLAAASFEVYNLERHVLRKVRGERGVSIEPFDGGEVGW
ncbi:hypothetical protein FIBSPDRAFT_923994 [Athelia psychrophila]|uniref:Uncharacterized protein n=1 Tax=Athelia psychrophila TaxID=1759441 RepID=A0A166X6Z2_9AGAM|nr:hypothetical protein FIBSPDRAFT_923994 [Fibularhizoctonia sp. CBS 109695]